jgi:tetratricopeptide (TPR) repeat protein
MSGTHTRTILQGIQLLEQFVLTNRENVVAHIVLGEALRKAGRYEEAAASYRVILEHKTKASAVVFSGYIDALLHINLDEWTTAARQSRVALDLHPDVTTLLELSVEISLGLNQLSRAEELLSGIPDSLGALPRWGKLMGQTACQRGEHEQAKKFSPRH